MPEPFVGFLPTPTNTPGWPTNPDTSNVFDFDTELWEKADAQIAGLTRYGNVLELSNYGGDANAITAETQFNADAPIDTIAAGRKVRLVGQAVNEAGGVTLSLDSMAAPMALKANDGSELATGYIKAGKSYLFTSNGTDLISDDVASSIIAGNRAPDDVFECRRTAGTSDGNSTGSGTRDHRLLNTVVRNSIATLDTDTGIVTLPPGGPYLLRGFVPQFGSGAFRAEIWNETDSEILVGDDTRKALGQVMDGGTTVQNVSCVKTVVTLASAKEIRLSSVATTGVSNGLGKAANLGSEDEVYSWLEITLIDETNETFEGPAGGALTESFEFEDDVGGGDPGAGRFAFDNASFAAATKLYISKQNADGDDIAALLASLAAGTSSIKADIRFVGAEGWALFSVSAFSDESTHYECDISLAAGTVDAFTAGESVLAKIDRSGAAGNNNTLTSIVVPTGLAGNENDYDVGAAGRQVLKVSTAGAAYSITGLVKKVTGETLIIENVDTTYPVTLENEDAASTDANRFAFGRDIVLNPGYSVTLRYDEDDDRWKVISLGYPTGEWDAPEIAVAYGATADIFGVASTRVEITSGSGPITSLGTSPNKFRIVRYSTDGVLTYNASSLKTKTGKDRYFRSGSSGLWMSDASGNAIELEHFPSPSAIPPNRNYIDNPSFNIWQRGTSFTIASATRTVVADRWKAYRAQAGMTVSRQAGFAVAGEVASSKYCLRAARDNGNSATQGIRIFHQLHEFVARGLAGQYVTLSFDVRAGANYSGGALTVAIHTGTGGGEALDLSTNAAGAFATGGAVATVSASIVPTTTPQRVVCTPLLLGATVADLAIRLNWSPTGTAGAADYIEITNVKLEVGAVSTQFVPPDEAADLAACQYTYRIVGPGLPCAVDSTTSIIIGAFIVPQMRVNPTVALLGEMNVNIGNATKTSSGGSISALASIYGVSIFMNGFTGLTVGQAGVLHTRAPSGSTDMLSLNAELL